MDVQPACPIFEAGGRSVQALVEEARAIAATVDASCFRMLDAYAREQGSVDGAPKGIQVEANKVAGGNFFWAPPSEEIRFEELRSADTEGDLFTIGALGMGLDEDFFKRFLAQAVKATDKTDEERRELVDPLRAARGCISLKECPGGWELYAFDLKTFGRLCGLCRDLVVVVPGHVDGMPVVRIAKDAFARPLVQGIDVALLVLPDSITSIAQDCFSCISARTIYLGSSLESFAPQACDLGLFSPKLKQRAYLVSHENKAIKSEGPAVLCADGTQLLFLEPPYADEVVLPEGIENVAPRAFCTGTPAPARVVYPDSLKAHTAGAFDRAVWIGNPSRRLRDSFVRDQIRNAHPDSIQMGECLYDVNEDGSVSLVAGPPPAMSASQRFAATRMLKVDETASPTGNERVAQVGQEATVLAIPEAVSGRSVRAIASHALPFAPLTVQLPSTMVRVDDGNTAKGARRLVIPDGVERIGADCFSSRTFDDVIDIPASVRYIGKGSFQYALCRFAPTGAVIHVPADALRSPFGIESGDGSPFDLEAYDRALVDGVNMLDRLGARIHRLAMPFELVGTACRHVIEYLEKDIGATLRSVAAEGSIEVLDALLDAGLLEGSRFDDMVELLRAANRMECVMHLVHRTQRAQTASQTESSRDRFAL